MRVELSRTATRASGRTSERERDKRTNRADDVRDRDGRVSAKNRRKEGQSKSVRKPADEMAFMMPVVKNEWDIYKTNRSRRSSECSNPQACRSRKVRL